MGNRAEGPTRKIEEESFLERKSKEMKHGGLLT
jgi:hypothetical protein